MKHINLDWIFDRENVKIDEIMVVVIRTVNQFQEIIQIEEKIDILMKNKCIDCETVKKCIV